MPLEVNPRLTPHRAWQLLQARTGFRFSRSTLYRWLNGGIMPADKLVGRWAVRLSAVDEMCKRLDNKLRIGVINDDSQTFWKVDTLRRTRGQ